MKKYIALIVLTSMLAACNNEPENLMSPCVGAKGSPCERTPLNQDIIHHQNLKV